MFDGPALTNPAGEGILIPMDVVSLNNSGLAKYAGFRYNGYLAKSIQTKLWRSRGKSARALFVAPGKDNEMKKTVLSVSKEVFRAKAAGERDREMWRVYLADYRGRVGSVYSARAVMPGDEVVVDLAERDGRLLPCLIWD